MDDDADLLQPGAQDEDFSLPKATLSKIAQEVLPQDVSCSKKTIDLLSDCCVEFIHLLSSEANEICEKEAKKLISSEHIIAALKSLGFETFVDEVNEANVEFQKQIKDRERKSFKLEKTGMTEEELIRSQELLFAAARAKLQQGITSPSGPLPPPFTPQGSSSAFPFSHPSSAAPEQSPLLKRNSSGQFVSSGQDSPHPLSTAGAIYGSETASISSLIPQPSSTIHLRPMQEHPIPVLSAPPQSPSKPAPSKPTPAPLIQPVASRSAISIMDLVDSEDTY